MNRYFLFLLSFSLLFSCGESEKKTKSEQATLVSRINRIQYEIISESKGNGVQIKNLSFDTTELFKESKAIKVIFNIEVAKEALKNIQGKGYTSFYFNLQCNPDKGKTYSQLNEYTDEKNKRIGPDKICFVFQQTEKTIEAVIPYRFLEMEGGSHDLLFTISAYPAKFKNDTVESSNRILDYISNEPYANTEAKIRIVAPKLYKVVIEMEKFELNTKVVDPSKYDFSVGGTGYPDLFWDLFCGEDFLYYSPVIKNSILYNKKTSSNPFYCTQDDIIKITVADYDNGPFNKQHDIIGIWKGKISDLHPDKTDSLKIETLEYMLLKTKIAE
jgi:predicted phosphatase